MIFGSVNAQIEATLRLAVIGADGMAIAIVAVIDAGYTGMLTLPPEVIEALSLRYGTVSSLILGDGSEGLLQAFDAELVWEGEQRRVVVHAAAVDPLIGKSLLTDHEVTIQVRPGGVVRIAALES